MSYFDKNLAREQSFKDYDVLYERKFLINSFLTKKKKLIKSHIEALMVFLCIFTICGFCFYLVVAKYVMGESDLIRFEITSPTPKKDVSPILYSQQHEQNIKANIQKLEKEQAKLLELNRELSVKTVEVEEKLSKASSDLYHITQTIVSMKGNQSIQVVTVPNYEANPKIKGAFTPPESPNNENWSKVQ